jgi:hypothetical protein
LHHSGILINLFQSKNAQLEAKVEMLEEKQLNAKMDLLAEELQKVKE